MEIEVNIQQTLDKLSKEKNEYLKDLKNAKTLYFKKLGEYATYVRVLSKKKSLGSIRQPPNQPIDNSKVFDESMSVLRAHSGKLLKMTDDEYRGLFSSIDVAKFSNTSSFNTLSSLSY